MKAPLVKGMDRLSKSETIVCRQLTQYAEVFLPYDQQNKYIFASAPEGVKAASSQQDGKAWSPTGTQLRSAPSIFLGYEMSGFCTRCCYRAIGCANKRPFKMNFVTADKVEKLDANGWNNVKQNADVPSEDGDGFRIVRPFKCGGCLCEVSELTVLNEDKTELGTVIENYEPYGDKCKAEVCSCINYFDVFKSGKQQASDKLYTLVVNRACFGAHDNCCGATCCKEYQVFDILDRDGKVVGNIQKTYAKEDSGCLGGVCRMLNDFSNYVVTFPEGASVEDKQLLVGALIQMEYLYFTPKDDDNNNGGGYSG